MTIYFENYIIIYIINFFHKILLFVKKQNIQNLIKQTESKLNVEEINFLIRLKNQ